MAAHVLLLHVYFAYSISGWSRYFKIWRTFGRGDRSYASGLLPASRPLGELLLRYRPSRQLQTLQQIPTLFWYFWCGELWPFCPQSLQENFWYHLRELAQEDSHLRELLRLVDQGIGDFLLREVQAELVQISRRISDLRRRVTYLSLCSLGIRSDPLFIPQLLPEPLLRRSRL